MIKSILAMSAISMAMAYDSERLRVRSRALGDDVLPPGTPMPLFNDKPIELTEDHLLAAMEKSYMEDEAPLRTRTTNLQGRPISTSEADLAALAKAQAKREQRSKKRHFQALAARWRAEPHFLKLNVWAIEQGIPPATVHEWAETFHEQELALLAEQNKDQ